MDDHRSPSPSVATDFSLGSRSGRSALTVLDMPVEGSRRAPKHFKGEASDVEPFLRKYERLAITHNLTEREKCDTILDYCGRVVRETIEGFPSFQQGTWEQLKEDIRVYWNADLESKRFRIKDLQRFISKSKEESILELRDWRQYLRNFVRIAGWLKGKKKISEGEYAYYLWMGLHRTFRKRLEARILLEDPEHDMSTPFTPKAIEKAAKALLSVDRFDTERLGSDNTYLDQSDDEDDDYFEEITGIGRGRAERDSPVPNRKVARFDKEDDSDTEDPEQELKETKKKQEKPKPTPVPTPSRKPEDVELDGLIQQLHTLRLDDPLYGAAYLKACRIDPNVQNCFYQPILRPPPQFSQNVTRDLPPHMGRSNMSQPPMRPSLPPLQSGTQGCFGCGQPGHVMNNCPEIQKYISKGQVLKDYRGRITDKDGRVIRRQEGENIVQAIERTLPKVNFIAYDGPAQDVDDEDEDPEQADVMVYPVERAQRITRPYRKETFDGVGVPSKGKENPKDKPKKTETSQKATAVHRLPMQRLVPVETQPMAFNPDNDVDMIDDRTLTQRKKPAPAEPATMDKPRWAPRASDVSKTVDPVKIAEKLLDLPVTLPVREIAGCSREVASSLIDMLKLKKVDTVPVASILPRTNLITSRTGSLIRLQMECNFMPVTFIVDTGSQLNIISEAVCKNIVRRPINLGAAIAMKDANGGTGHLLGLVENIPLKLGHISTPINAFIAENPPFDGLLGRPWQQAHKISIVEKPDGTYLEF
ncbi:uncharacterized protein TRAVEDRAFT_137787, partial [Trametes versicolor FP-101664 SS1]